MSRTVPTTDIRVSTSRSASRTERLVDAFATWGFRLPPQRVPYSVTSSIPVLMRDGVRLLTDHYAPKGAAYGTVVLRSPYQRAGIVPHVLVGLFAARGYHVVVQSCRGTFGSEGRFVPGENEIEDGADTVAWLREQPWFDGRFVGVGGSYLSYTLWSMLMDPPPEMVAGVSFVSFHDFFRVVHGTGAFTLNDSLDWCDSLARQERTSLVGEFIGGPRTKRRLARAYAGLPVTEGEEQYVGAGSDWYRQWATRTEPMDPYWRRRDLTAALDRVDVPVLIISGWQDLFLGQTLEQYQRLRERGVDATLTIGPWTHAEVLTRGGPRILREALDWVDVHLGGPASGVDREPVSYVVTGADEWRSAVEWPPSVDGRTLYLAPGRRLADDLPPASAGAVGFTYDPNDPTPTLGGRLLARKSGYREDSALALRSDTLVFATAPLSEPLEVVGVPRATLAHRSDPVGGDLWVRISEVAPDGRSQNVTEGFVASPAAGMDGRTVVELDPVAHRFAAGSRLGLLVGGGSFPRYARNLGMPGPRNEGTAMTPTRQTVDLGSGASALSLPVLR
jgi:putative CocE/NonD family hydrolase